MTYDESMEGIEWNFVEWLRGQPARNPATLLGIGDDMAVVSTGSRGGAPGRTEANRVLLSSDMLLDEVHFDTARHALALIGRKAIACSLSDCAAMAVRPLAATVSLALPASFGLADAQELFRGMLAIAAEYALAIVGGDTTRWSHPLAIDVAIAATPYEGIEPVCRSGARRGDRLFVTGLLGGSLLGRHLTFPPRVDEARGLAAALGPALHAMMDISDGLSLDLWRMCQASNVGARLDEDLLGRVISEDARRSAAADGRAALEHALADGEDFELLLALGPDAATAGDGTLPTLYRIGHVTEAGLSIVRCDGRTEPLAPKGYLH